MPQTRISPEALAALGDRFAAQDAETESAIANGEDFDGETPTYKGFANGGVAPRELDGVPFEDFDGTE